MVASYNENDREMFADELKAARAQKSWSVAEVADKIGFSPSTIKNIESGQRAPTPQQAERLDRAFGTPGTFARTERRMRGVPFSAGFRPFTPHEQGARAIKTYQHSLVPGQFQTEDYAFSILSTFPEIEDDDLKEQLAGRIERQKILYREDPPPPRFWALLDEHVLYRNVGGPAVMHTQMQRLLELAQMPRNHVYIIPDEKEHCGLTGAFVIAETGDPVDVVFFETIPGGHIVEAPGMAEFMSLTFDTLRMEALTESASLAKIEEAVQLWQQRTET